MAVNAFLKIDGVKGPATADGMKDAIEILSFSFSSSMPTTSQGGGLAESTGHPDFTDLTIMKSLDATTTDLFSTLTTGKRLTGPVELIYQKAIGGKQEPYFTIKLTGALLTSHSLSGSNENPSESLSFSFQKVEISYTDEKDGKPQGAKTKGYDIKTQKAS